MNSNVEEIEWYYDKEKDQFVEERPVVKKRRYIRTVPLEWFMCAAQLPGQSLAVGIAAWHLSGIRRNNTVVLPSAFLCEIGISRHQKYRALASLKKAGLIHVDGINGKNPTVTLIEP